jgi:hypothetical protein
MVSPIVSVYHKLIGDTGAKSTPTPTAPPSPGAPVQSAQGDRTGTSAAGPSFLASAAAASTNNLAGGKSLLGQ